MTVALAVTIGLAVGLGISLLTQWQEKAYLRERVAELEDRLQASSLSEYRTWRPAMPVQEQDDESEPVWQDETGLVRDDA